MQTVDKQTVAAPLVTTPLIRTYTPARATDRALYALFFGARYTL